MAWYHKYVQPRVNQLRVMTQRVVQACVSYVKPSKSRRSWLVGSSLLLVLAPASAMLVHAQSGQSNSVIDMFTSADEIESQSLDLDVKSSLGQYGQSSSSASSDVDSSTSTHDAESDEVSLQATINDQSANVTVNGTTTPLNPSQDSYHTSVDSKNGTTNIDISIKNNGSNTSGSGLDVSTSSSIKIKTGGSYGSSSDEDSEEDYRHPRDYR